MIQITETLRIVKKDDNNLGLEEYKELFNKITKETRYDWALIGYYGDLASAIKGAQKVLVNDMVDTVKTMDEVLAKLDHITEIINNIGWHKAIDIKE